MKKNIKKVLFLSILFISFSLKNVYANPEQDIETINNKILILEEELNELNSKLEVKAGEVSEKGVEIDKINKIIENMDKQLKLNEEEKKKKEDISDIEKLAKELSAKFIETRTKGLLSGNEDLSKININPLSFSLVEEDKSFLNEKEIENKVLEETSKEFKETKDKLIETKEVEEIEEVSLTSKKEEIEQNIYDLKREIVKIKEDQLALEEEARRQAEIEEQERIASENSGDIVGIASKYLGVPYVWGGTTPSGFDCSGLVQYVYRELGIYLSRTTYTQIYDGYDVTGSELQVGDLIFPNPDHVMIYIGGGQVIHAPEPGTVVRIDNLPSVWKAIRIL